MDHCTMTVRDTDTKTLQACDNGQRWQQWWANLFCGAGQRKITFAVSLQTFHSVTVDWYSAVMFWCFSQTNL